MKAYDEARTDAVSRARQLRRNSTDAGRLRWRALRSSLPQYKWRRQMPVGPYFADFACYSERLIVELDGGQHVEAMNYDANRTRLMEAKGYRVVRVWNNDVLGNLDGVIEEITSQLSSPSRSDAAGPSLSQGRGLVEACQ